MTKPNNNSKLKNFNRNIFLATSSKFDPKLRFKAPDFFWFVCGLHFVNTWVNCWEVITSDTQGIIRVPGTYVTKTSEYTVIFLR